MRLGIDIGSTTVKLVAIDENNDIRYSRYERHLSNVFEKVDELIREMYAELGDVPLKTVITGSGGLSLAKLIGIKFEQEVISCSKAVEELIPETEVAIELGGEDAKITFYGATIEQRMNGTCAGGTGAFIDQMAILLNTDAAGLNKAAKDHKMIYPIAARCGVFAITYSSNSSGGTIRCSRTASPIISPTGRRGESDEYGSWKIIWSFGRSRRISLVPIS